MENIEQLKQELERLRQENAKLVSKAPKTSNGLKVTDKGGISLYGLGRFPVTLYKDQWLKLLDKAPEIKEFIVENDAKLTKKVA